MMKRDDSTAAATAAATATTSASGAAAAPGAIAGAAAPPASGARQPDRSLFKKYDVPAPRYTSYPTVPYWSESPTTERWLDEVRAGLAPEASSWSMYLHVPFCESLCTFCGCNTSITRDHGREEPYVKLLLSEWEAYASAVPGLRRRPLRQLHLGGGSPTFLSAASLTALLKPILEGTLPATDGFEGSIEVDPRRTRRDQLEALRALGFNRVSLGVQDFSPEIQRLINRSQPREATERIAREARELGYESVNFDLIYGLPKQTAQSVAEMAKITVEIRPDRIALYSFALVPWIKPAQRLFKDEDLPMGEAKRHLYEIAREILIDGGYREIGMDHFALPNDALSQADLSGQLHRNFMGYVDRRTDVLLGLGVSAIGEAPGCFHQNEKVLPVYERRLQAGQLPTLRGHVLTAEDRRRREQILRFMTQWKVELEDEAQAADAQAFLQPLLDDGLVEIRGRELILTPQGRPFLRNACMALDSRLRAKAPETKVFSSSL
jgi:oxygen-independent coproporphyrinogen-3 oxidase